MNKSLFALIVLFLAALSGNASAQSRPGTNCAASDAWATPAEVSCYRTTPRYDETMAYVHRVAVAAPKQVRVETFGKTPEGRDLVLVIVSGDGVFDPAKLRQAGRPLVLIQNAIHAGEMDGKDSCLALLRDMAINKSKADLLRRAVVLIIPIYNADGHERFGRYNRINQNGPEQMGWRAQSQNLNLNRDYLKAQAPETRDFLKMWNRWLPDFFVDDHVTDGADFQYDVTYGLDTGPDVDPALARWQEEVLAPYMEKSVTQAGHRIFPYVQLFDDTDLSKGLKTLQDVPRFSTGYTILQNRPGMLVEMHMLKDYKTRVTGNYEILRALLEVVNRDAEKLVAMNRAADAATVASGKAYNPQARFPLQVEASSTVPVQFLGYKYNIAPSEISGAPWIQYTRDPLTLTIPRQMALRATRTIAPPRAYIVPAEWTSVIDVLTAHGLRLERTTSSWTGEVETYRCTAQWQPQPFEGRHVIAGAGEFGTRPALQSMCQPTRATMTFPAGSVVVPLDQRSAKVAIHWLEPEAPDSAVAWGFFDSIFEQKEYGESYVMEKLAREMLAKDPKLKAEFEARLAADAKFAASPQDRLNFFYERSPWADPRLGLYPVGRLTSIQGLPVSSAP
jgi:murein tripeptide amidase MpaA